MRVVEGRNGQPIVLSVPGSKSQTQRALILAALAEGTTLIERPLACDDSARLRDALRVLGIPLVVDEDADRWCVTGSGGRLQAPATPLWCGDAGTVARFLAPLALLTSGAIVLDGSVRLRQRPMDGLTRALRQLGVTARTAAGSDGDAAATSLPLALQREDALGEAATVDATRSSQFASALLMVGPCLPRGLRLRLAVTPPTTRPGGEPPCGPPGLIVSRPYLEMTVRMMRDFGAEVTPRRGAEGFDVAPGRYQARSVVIEGDWSSAAFMLAGAWISGRSLQIDNLDPDSAQGDRAISELLSQLDDGSPHRFDLSQCPDLVAPLAAAAVFGKHPTEITNVAHARLKESDRLAVLARQLARAGVCIEERPDGMRIDPIASRLVGARLDPGGDHRMAMAIALLSLREPRIEVTDRSCVSKSYPGFWSDLDRLRG